MSTGSNSAKDATAPATPAAASDAQKPAPTGQPQTRPGPQPGSAPQQGPRKIESEAEAQLLALLKVEGDAREAASPAELALLAANESRKLCRARQVFVLAGTAGGKLKVEAISSLAAVDRNTPLVQTIEHTLAALDRDTGAGEIREFDLGAYAGEDSTTAAAYPFPKLAWVPLLKRDKSMVGGLLMAREQPWLERDFLIAKRLASAFGHAWGALDVSQGPLETALSAARISTFKPRHAVILGAGLGVLALFPVPMTTLAPLEIAAKDPFIVTAPIDGVISDIAVSANETVTKDQVLVKFVDTNNKAKLEVASREVLVAAARLKKATQQSFTDQTAAHDLGLARAELDLRTAERDYAQDLLDKTVIKADRPGIAVYGDKKDLVGKPVGTGERIMELADPKKAEIRIDIPVSDSIILSNGARVKAFLDSDPLNPIEAHLVRADYKARLGEGNVLAYRAVAEIAPGTTVPRLGTRGTAQLYGERVSLGFYLLRRPISAVRQWLGR